MKARIKKERSYSFDCSDFSKSCLYEPSTTYATTCNSGEIIIIHVEPPDPNEPIYIF